MMDKIVVTAADIEKLLAWRDEHNDPVRSMPVPLREVEIQIVESGISIKCFRSDKKLMLTVHRKCNFDFQNRNCAFYFPQIYCEEASYNVNIVPPPFHSTVA